MVKRESNKISNKKSKGATTLKRKQKNKKNKQSTPVQSFNEKAKQAALRQSLTASARRLQSVTSDTDTNRSFLIFNTPTPQPPSIQIFNVETDLPRNAPFEIIASNDPTDFMETSSMSPQTQRPQLIATSSLGNNTPSNNDQDLEFNKSTKKIDKNVEKINTINAVKEHPEQEDTINSPEPQVIYSDSSNSSNGADYTQPSQSEQAPNGDKAIAELQQPSTSNKDGLPKHLQVETEEPS